MRRMVIVGALLITATVVHAQTLSEWIKQKETQIKYLLQQVASLKAYGEVINKGYDIAHTGLTDIFGSKDSDFRQHSDYFLSLLKVKPSIRNYSKVFLIYKMYADIKRWQQLLQPTTGSSLTDKERDYVNNVFANLISGSSDLLTELSLVLSDDQLELKDDERVGRIDRIYTQMQDRYEFFQSFSSEIKLLALNRLKEKAELGKVSSIYGIK
jgi:hypothetical protein